MTRPRACGNCVLAHLPQNLNTGTGHTRGRTRNGRHTRHRTQRTHRQRIFLPRCERRIGRWMRCSRARCVLGRIIRARGCYRGCMERRLVARGRSAERAAAAPNGVLAPSIAAPHALFMRDRSVPGGLLGAPRRLDGPEGHRGRSARRFLSAGATGATGGATFLPLGA
jgi:hypothetical protein